MKTWYYWIVSGVLTSLLAYYRYRYSKLNKRFKNIDDAMRQAFKDQQANREANEKKQKSDTTREKDHRLQHFNPDDPWDGLQR